MKRLSAQIIVTNSGPPLRRGIITVEDDGTVTDIEDTSGKLKEKDSVEFHNGIIIPGFINCHCHLELSHMKGVINQGTRLGRFIENIRGARGTGSDAIIHAAESADTDMYNSGVNLCADVSNTSITFNLKKKSRICYINLLEVFGVDPSRAEHRLEEIIKISGIAREMELNFQIVPHSVYSLSLPLFRLLREITGKNRIISIHFMESAGEVELVRKHTGPLIESYERSGLLSSGIETVKSHEDAILNEIVPGGNMILVHNTFLDRKTLRKVKKRSNLFWCLCPNSNLYIESRLPPLDLLIDEKCVLTVGTDSFASNHKLDILEELKTLQFSFPEVSLEELIGWATINGARALEMDDRYGKIEPGMHPGLLLLQNTDLINMKLLPDSSVKRLV